MNDEKTNDRSDEIGSELAAIGEVARTGLGPDWTNIATGMTIALRWAAGTGPAPTEWLAAFLNGSADYIRAAKDKHIALNKEMTTQQSHPSRREHPGRK